MAAGELWPLGSAGHRAPCLRRPSLAPGPVQGPVPSPLSPPASVVGEAGEGQEGKRVQAAPDTNLTAWPEPPPGAVLEDFLWLLQRTGAWWGGTRQRGPPPQDPSAPRDTDPTLAPQGTNERFVTAANTRGLPGFRWGH